MRDTDLAKKLIIMLRDPRYRGDEFEHYTVRLDAGADALVAGLRDTAASYIESCWSEVPDLHVRML